MSIIYTTKNGKKINLTPHIKKTKFQGDEIYLNLSKKIPKTLKKYYPEHYRDYVNAMNKRNNHLNNIHANLK